MDLGMTEMIFIFLLALVILGPRKLPELGRQLGKALNEFKRASNEFKYQLESEIRQIDDKGNLVETARDLHQTFSRPVGQTVFNTIMSGVALDEGEKQSIHAPRSGSPPEAPEPEPLTTNPAAVEAAQAIAAEIEAARMKNWQDDQARATAANSAEPTTVAREPNV